MKYLYDEIKELYGNDVTIFIISDTHFNHQNIIKYCDRPFKDETHMNKVLIHNWNRVVGKNDVVIHLGDVALSSANKSIDVLKDSIKHRGSTIRTYGSLGKPGEYQKYLKVHLQEGSECGKNNIVKKIKVGGRGTYYCDGYQK